MITLVPWLTKMPENPIRSLLSRIIRGSANASEVELVYRHRGASNDELKILVSRINRLGKGWFMLNDGETQIPYHRVLVVRNTRSGVVLWQKRATSSTSDRGQ